jgi:hypothetical protein
MSVEEDTLLLQTLKVPSIHRTVSNQFLVERLRC